MILCVSQINVNKACIQAKYTRGTPAKTLLPTSGAGRPRDTAYDVTVKPPMLLRKADSRAFTCKRSNLHCDAHVAAENKSTWPLKTNAHDSVLGFRTCVYFYVGIYEMGMQNVHRRSLLRSLQTASF